MHKLSIDIGNSAAKIAVFAGKEIIYNQRIDKLSVNDLAVLIEKFSPEKSIISTVREEISELETFLQQHTQYTRFSTLLTNGVQNKYKTPVTLGLDRWAVVLAANGLFPNTASLVIDAGTCITYELLNSAKEYYGGSISPGINMRFKAMHTFTRRLPLVSWDTEAVIPDGNDTQSAILNGVLQGIINEIEGFIALNNKKESTLRVILTGGDANFLYKQLQNSIFAPQIITDPFLVLKGLNEAIAD
ncbi:type III pantothenate kinase [Pedobacter punctiformis]|uniref:Type III pantothenate kinase n=1 Tax=Pedobacter punctiformis TaxID=3004097 RepID=A0ABT4L527_9SPHI|nr:type III pantothenate kinase [Pedobacter sp. HCMS5-2]MCZ4242936.1 type III pantothenate kinase [Pedobacter sp. HCMS5-2]